MSRHTGAASSRATAGRGAPSSRALRPERRGRRQQRYGDRGDCSAAISALRAADRALRSGGQYLPRSLWVNLFPATADAFAVATVHQQLALLARFLHAPLDQTGLMKSGPPKASRQLLT